MIASMTVTDGATLTVDNTLVMGNSGTSNVSTLTIDNGHVKLEGVDSATAGKYNMAGHYPSSNTTIHLKSGSFEVDKLLNLGWHGKGTFTQDGGIAEIEQIHFNSFPTRNGDGSYLHGAHLNCWGTINLNGGVLKLGSIVSDHDDYSDHYTITLTGGTLQPKNDRLEVGLKATNRGRFTLYTGAAQTLEWSGKLTGGRLNMEGAGKFVLSGTIEPGTLWFAGLYSDNQWQNITVDVTGKLTGVWGVCGATVNIREGSKISAASLSLTDTLDRPTSIINHFGGEFTITSSSVLTFDENGISRNITNNSIFKIGHWAGNGTYNLNGGTLNATSTWAQIGWDGHGTLQITDGTANLKGVIMVQHKTSNGYKNIALNLDGGRLNLGEYGMKVMQTDNSSNNATSWECEQGANQTVRLGGGTLGALDDWSSKLNMSLTAGSTTTVDTKNPNNSNAHTITLSGILSGDGGLSKTGDGTLILSGENTYTGKTTVEQGTLELNGSVAGLLELQNDAILTGTGTMQSLAFAEGAGNARILYQVGNDTAGMTILGDAMLQEGMLDFLFEDIHAVADQALPILQAASYSGWDGALDALLSEDWQGIIHLSQIDTGIYATVDSAAVPEPGAWLLCLLGASLLFWQKRGKMSRFGK